MLSCMMETFIAPAIDDDFKIKFNFSSQDGRGCSHIDHVLIDDDLTAHICNCGGGIGGDGF